MARLVLVGCFGIICLMNLSLARTAPVTKTETKSSGPTTAEIVRKALDQTVNLKFSNQPLNTVLTSLGEQHNINIVLDRVATQQMGFEPNELQIDFTSNNTKLRNGLRMMLTPYNLSFAIIGDSLLVTTEEQAIQKQLKQRISVDLDNVQLQKALKEVATNYAVNIVLDPRVTKNKINETPISLQVDDVPLDTVVRLMAEMGSLKPVRMGNVLFVTTEERAEKLRDNDYGSSPPTVTPSLPLEQLRGGGLGGLQLIPAQGPAPAVQVAPAKEDAPPKKDQ